MHAHTPGPWYADGWFDEKINISDRSLTFIALVDHRATPGTQMANAFLIAAAPDEHAANENTIAKLEYYIGNPSAWAHYDEALSEVIREVVETARAAIAKSTGK